MGQDAVQKFKQANPGLCREVTPEFEGGRASFGTPVPVPADPSQFGDVTRVVQSGGGVADLVLHPVFTPLEQMFRKLPPSGLNLATRAQPSTFEIGAFTVPENFALLLCDYRFQIFRLSGAVPGEFVPLESRRLSTEVGFDVSFSQFHKGNLAFELIPVDATAQNRAAFNGVVSGGTVFPNTAPQQQIFEKATAGLAAQVAAFPSFGPPGALTRAPQTSFDAQGTFVPASGSGSSLLPQEQRPQGPSKFPFSYVINAGQGVQLRVSVFAPIRIPLGFFEALISGYLVPTNAMAHLLGGIRPPWGAKL
jgi:hypothetical protein